MQKNKTVTDLNIRPETIKCLEENRVTMLSDNTLNSMFLQTQKSTNGTTSNLKDFVQ